MQAGVKVRCQKKIGKNSLESLRAHSTSGLQWSLGQLNAASTSRVTGLL